MYKPSPEDPVRPDAYQEILENLEPFANISLANVTVEDCQVPTSAEKEAQQNAANPKKQSQDWADSIDESDESGTAGSEKPQEVKLEVKHQETTQPKTYCLVCKVDSHSEEQCGKVAFVKHTNKRKLSRRDSKPGKEMVSKKKKNFHTFKGDLESVVLRGQNNVDVQYVMEIDDTFECMPRICYRILATRLLLVLSEVFT